MQVLVIGAGTWGIALATVLASNNHTVHVWHRNINFVKELSQTRIHPNLKTRIQTTNISFTSEFCDLETYDSIVIAVPSQSVREVLEKLNLKQFSLPIISVSKGIENSTNLLMNEVIQQTTNISPNNVIVLSGPSHAEEVVEKKVTTVVCACTQIEQARYVQKIFANDYFRVYSSDDVIGVEIGGAIKNVIAIASGICIGLGLGDNTQAALITRGLEEIKRLGTAMGGRANTFSGLSGLGDLLVTSFSKFSRNRHVGECLGQGMTLEEVLNSMSMVAEGVLTTKSVLALKNKYYLDMPISTEIHKVLFENKNPQIAIRDLMNRKLVDEHV